MSHIIVDRNRAVPCRLLEIALSHGTNECEPHGVVNFKKGPVVVLTLRNGCVALSNLGVKGHSFRFQVHGAGSFPGRSFSVTLRCVVVYPCCPHSRLPRP